MELMDRGCYWNSFIMVGRADSFLKIVRRSAPHLFDSFQSVVPALLTNDEEAGVADLYRAIPSISFSTDVLAACPDNLTVLCSKGLQWVDVGDVERALSVRAAAAGPLRGQHEYIEPRP